MVAAFPHSCPAAKHPVQTEKEGDAEKIPKSFRMAEGEKLSHVLPGVLWASSKGSLIGCRAGMWRALIM